MPSTPPAPDDWNRLTAALRRVARAIVRDDSLAEDLVQGAYLSSLRRGVSEPRPGWLRAIVRSRAIDSVRRRARGERAVRGAAAARPASAESTDEIVGRLELQQRLLEAVRSLDEPYREVVYLRYFEDLGPTRIAHRLGVPVKTVKTRLARGLARLAERLRREHGLDERGWWSAFHAFAAGRLPAGTVPAPSPLGPVVAGIVMKKTALVAVVAVALVATLVFNVVRGGGDAPVRGPVEAPELTEPDPALSGPDEARPPVDEVGARTEVADVGTAPAPLAPPPTTGALRLHVRWSDETDAEGVAVVVESEGARYGARRRQRRVTDAGGLAVFAEVRPGTVRLSVDRGAAREGWDHALALEPLVVAGEETREELTLDEGVFVRGRVVDGDGRGVPGAGVWLTSRSTGWTRGRVVCHAGAAGTFELRDVPGDQSLGALAAGFAPSALVDLDVLDTSSGVVDVVLELVAEGGSLAGRVTDEAGDPLADAVVVAGSSDGYLEVRANDTVAEHWSPIGARTDEAGRYRIDGLEPGEHVVRVRRLGRPTWLGAATVAAEQTAELDVALPLGATLHGVVRDAEGQPVEGATVHVFDEPLREMFLQNGQIDYEGAFAHEATRTDAEGRYELPLVPPGRAFAFAMAPFEDVRREPGSSGPMLYTKRELEPLPAERVEWNPVLSAGRTIEGVARYKGGEPIRNVFVNLKPTNGGESRGYHTPDGTFRFIQLPDEPHDVWVQIWEPPPGAAPVQAAAVMPGGAPLELVAGFDAPVEHEPCTVTLRFEDAGGRVATPDAVGVILEAGRNFSWNLGQRDGERWTFDVGEPDTYTPLAVLEDRIVAIGEPFETVPGGTLDLGTLRTGPGAVLVLRFERPGPTAELAFPGYLKLAGTRRSERIQIGPVAEHRIENLEPGAGSITLLADGIVKEAHEFETVAGEETVLEIALRPALPVPYRILWNSVDEPGETVVRIVDRADGSTFTERTLKDPTRYPNPLELRVQAPPGEYSLVVEMSNGKRGTCDFDVTSLDVGSVPEVEVDLR